MPFYEVQVIASVSMLVEAANEEGACEIAFDEVDLSSAGHKEVSESRLLETDQQIDQLRRLADQVLGI